MIRHEAIQAATQISDVFRDAPDVKQFDVHDSHGNPLLSTGRHVLPNAVIGAGVALYVDSFKNRMPDVSAKIAAASCFVIGLLYEGVDACGDNIPNAHGIAEQCKLGYLDRATPLKATADSVADVLLGTSVGFFAATAVAFSAFALRRRFHRKPFYKMTESEERKHLALWDYISPKDRQIIKIVPDNSSS